MISHTQRSPAARSIRCSGPARFSADSSTEISFRFGCIADGKLQSIGGAQNLTKGSGFLPREQRINLSPIIAFTTERPDSWQLGIGLSQSSTRSSSAHRRGSRRFHEVRTKACVNKEALASRGLEVQNRRETFCKRLRFKTPIGWPGICLSSLASAPRPAFGAFVPMWSPEGNESV